MVFHICIYECEAWPVTKTGLGTCIEVILEHGAEENTWILEMEGTVG
jgi:hypothetical protein